MNKKENKEILFTQDIVKKVLPKMKYYTEENLTHLFKVMVDYLVEESENKDTVAIELPYVGVLHENFHLFKQRREKRRQNDAEWDDYYDTKLANIRMSCDYVDGFCAHTQKPYYIRYLRPLKEKYRLPPSRKTYKGEFQSIQALAVIAREQNMFYNTHIKDQR